MIGSLRRKFVAIVMTLVGAVLVFVLAFSYWRNYTMQWSQVDHDLEMSLDEEDGFIPVIGRAPISQDGAGRNDVAGAAGFEVADRERGAGECGNFSCDEFLQAFVDVNAGVDRVYAEFRGGAVRADAFDGDFKAVRGREGCLAVQDGSGRAGGKYVLREGSVDTVKHPFFDGRVAAGEDFLGGLEEQLDRSVQLAFPLFEKLCGSEERSCVHVVAAGVHVAVGGGERLAGLFAFRERVHVAAQQDAAAALADGRDDAGDVVKNLVGNAQFIELSGHIGDGFREMQSQLRNLMQIAADFGKLRLHFFCFCQNRIAHSFFQAADRHAPFL